MRDSHLGRFLLTVIVIGFVCLCTEAVQAQLTPADIDSLKEVGKAEGWTFEVSLNEATQYPLQQLAGFRLEDGWEESGRWDDLAELSTKSLPSRFDWRDSNAVTPIRNQGGCNSCWAFATIACVESAILRRDGTPVDLSEQWLVSCNVFDWLCDFGGQMAFQFLADRQDQCGLIGAPLDADYPYTGTQTACDCNAERRYTVHDWAYIAGSPSGKPNAARLKVAVLEYGPIAVALHVDAAFQAYSGGIFNACIDGSTNHALAIVGWDDNLGEDGVWFVRNSWGENWGDSGYMAIPYGCNRIGTSAAFCDYRPVKIMPGTTLVEAPAMVTLSASAPGDTVLSCHWDFGDGASSDELSPTHEFVDPGPYDVTVTVQTPSGPITKTAAGAVSLYADLLTVSSVEVEPGSSVAVQINLKNFLPVGEMGIPISWDGPWDVTFDSVNATGCRTENFEDCLVVEQDPENKQARLYARRNLFRDKPFLEPGEGPVMNVWFTVPPQVSGDRHPIRIVPYGVFKPSVLSYLGGYFLPTGAVGELIRAGSTCCVGRRGNLRSPPNCDIPDGPTSLGDLTLMIDYLFISLKPLCCEAEADLAPGVSDGQVSLGDLTMLLDHLFISLRPLPECD